MFRESSAIDSERTASGVRSLYAKYSENEDWFTGTPDSVDRRIAQCKRIANAAKAASVRLAGRDAGIQYIALAQEMDSDRTALEGLRRDLLTASSDRYAEDINDGSGPPMESPLAPPTHEDHLHVDAPAHQDHLHQGSRYAAKDEGNRPGNHTSYQTGFGRTIEKTRDPGEYQGKHRAEARFFIAEQECDDLGELLIRAQNHAERVSSTLPARQSRAHVASFVEAVRGEYQPPRQQRTASYSAPQDFPADLMFLE